MFASTAEVTQAALRVLLAERRAFYFRGRDRRLARLLLINWWLDRLGCLCHGQCPLEAKTDDAVESLIAMCDRISERIAFFMPCQDSGQKSLDQRI